MLKCVQKLFRKYHPKPFFVHLSLMIATKLNKVIVKKNSTVVLCRSGKKEKGAARTLCKSNALSKCLWCDSVFSTPTKLVKCTICGGPIQDIGDRTRFMKNNSNLTECACIDGVCHLYENREPYEQEI